MSASSTRRERTMPTDGQDTRSAATKRRKPRRARELGVSPADYDRMLEAQGGKCAIAGCNRTPKTRRFHVDHDHATGQVRGLLCHWHNRIMPKNAAEAYHLFTYLANHEARQRDAKAWEELRESMRRWEARA